MRGRGMTTFCACQASRTQAMACSTAVPVYLLLTETTCGMATRCQQYSSLMHLVLQGSCPFCPHCCSPPSPAAAPPLLSPSLPCLLPLPSLPPPSPPLLPFSCSVSLLRFSNTHNQQTTPHAPLTWRLLASCPSCRHCCSPHSPAAAPPLPLPSPPSLPPLPSLPPPSPPPPPSRAASPPSCA